MDLRGYLRAIRKGWWLVLLVTLLGGGISAFITYRTPPAYQSSVTFFVSTSLPANGSALQSDQYAQARVNSLVKLLDSDSLARAIIAKKKLPMTNGAVAAEITGSVDLNTVLLTAVVTDTSPARSFEIADAISTEFGPVVDKLGGTTVTPGSALVLDVTSGPNLNPNAVSPRKKLTIGLGIAGGLILGLLGAAVRELLDNTLRNTDAMRAQTGRPTLGAIPYEPSAKKAPLVIEGAARSIRAESFRQLRTNLQFSDVDSPVQVVMVTSSVAGEGKSTSAVNLAIVFTESGKKVLLLEGDLRRPRVADYLGLERAVGLSNVLAGQVDLQDVLQPWGSRGLMVLPSGTIPPNPSELLGSRGMAAVMETLRRQFEVIIIDTPPLLPVTDAAVAAAYTDGVLLVIRQGKTTRNQVAMALNSLEAVDARVLGCVLNMVPRKGLDGRANYDGYGYYEDDPARGPLAKATAPEADASFGLAGVDGHDSPGPRPEDAELPHERLQPAESAVGPARASGPQNMLALGRRVGLHRPAGPAASALLVKDNGSPLSPGKN